MSSVVGCLWLQHLANAFASRQVLVLASCCATQTFGFKQVVDEARSKYHLFMYQEEEEEKKILP